MTIFRRHLPFYIAIVFAVVVFLLTWLTGSHMPWALAANAFFIAYLVLTLAGLRKLSAEYLKHNAASSDMPVWIIFLITLGAVGVAVVSLFTTINAQGATQPLDYGVALAAVPLGWLTIHMMAAIHYAHEFWQPDTEAPKSKAGRQPVRGLEFPGTKEPRGIDFAYFAFVIGMTAQTSDTALTNSAMRRFALLHGVVSFFFNTVLVAAAVNVAVTLGN
ncbi:MAG: DUF1345 domain-containing protein [Rhizobiaceae bacterium]